MSGRHLHCSNPACPAFITDDLDLRARLTPVLGRRALAGRLRRSQKLATNRTVQGLTRHLLRDIGVDHGAA